MRVITQRSKAASVSVDQVVISEIPHGQVILLGIEAEDGQEDIDWLCRKLSNLRIFSDENGLMNLNAQQVNASFLVISQFTLYASTKKGNRPSYIKAARPEKAEPLYMQFMETLKSVSGLEVYGGKFGADMKLQLINDGPVSIILDSKNKE